jgi:hypothetical protein
LSTTTIEVTHHPFHGDRVRVSDEAVLRLWWAFFLPLSLFFFIALIFMPANPKINCVLQFVFILILVFILSIALFFCFWCFFLTLIIFQFLP